MRRVISLWLPRLSTERIARRERESHTTALAAAPGKPLAAVAKEQGRLVIAAVNGAAQANGVVPGQALADARALIPDLDVADHDPAQDLRLLGHLADWCGRYSPLVALDGNDGLFLDVAGCAHLFGGESAMLADLCRRIVKLGFSVRGALADTPGAAWACARYAAAAPVVVAPMAARAALGPLPVAALRLSPATADALARLGLKRIGDLYDLPRAPLAARFGEDVRRRLDAALGESEEPISPRHPLAAHRAQMSFAEPIVAADDIARAVQHLLHGVCERLQREQSGARRLELLFYRVDGTFARAAIGTARPLRDPERLALLFAQHLERLDPGFGVETMALAVPLVESCAPNQIALPHAHPNGAHGDRITQQDARAALIERLSNRFGPAHVFYLVPRQSHVPERAQRLARAL